MLRDIKKTALLSVAVAGLTVLGFGSFAGATIISPGHGDVYGSAFGAADITTVSLSGLTLVASTGPQSFTTVGGSNGHFESGTAIEDVFSNSSGGLDFAYQFVVDSANPSNGAIDSIEMDSFLGFTTDVNYASAFPSGDGFVTPTTGAADSGVASTSDGAAITFGSLTPPIGDPTNSPIFVIVTTGNLVVPGKFTLQDDGVATFNGYAPATAPLPATAGTGLALLGCLGAFSVIRRRVMA
jgi:hypothetical protein